MASLSSLLVERGVVEMRAVEDAIARQVVYGGDLATNLLEVAAPDEEALLELVAEVAQLPPAPSGKLLALPEIVALLPADRAIQHGVFPLARTQNVLVVAVAEPLPADVEQELAFALGVDLRQLVALWIRVREALGEYYQAPLERRAERLLARLAGEAMSSRHPPPMPTEPDLRLPKPESIPPPTFGSGSPMLSAALRSFSSARLPRVSPPPASPPPEPAPPVEVLPVAPDEPEIQVHNEQGSLVSPAAASTPDPPLLPPAEPEAGATAEAEAPRRIAAIERARPSIRIRHKGPLTLARAEEELREAAAGDAVLATFFDFSKQFFEFTALFVVHGDVADGRDAHGPGAAASAVTSLAVGLGGDGLFATVRAKKAPLVAAPATEADADVLSSLERPTGERRVALLPLVVRDKVVAVLFGDDGASSVRLPDIGDVVSLAALASRSLEALIVRKKAGRTTTSIGVPAPPPPAPRARDKTAEQAVRALAVTAREDALASARAPEVPAAPALPDAQPDPAATRVEESELRVSPAAESIRAPASPVEEPRAASRDAPTTPEPRKRRITQDLEPSPEVRPEVPSESAGSIGDALSRVAERAPPIPDVRPPSAPPGPKGPTEVPERPRRKTLTGMQPLAPTAFEHTLSPAELQAARAEVVEPPAPEPSPPPPPVTSGYEPAPPDHPAQALEPPLPLVARRAHVWPPLPREDEEAPRPVNRDATTRRDGPVLPARSAPPARHEAVSVERVGDADDLAVRLTAFVSAALGGGADDEAFTNLVREGDRLVPLLMAQFPGPLRVDRQRARDQLPAASQCGPVLELVVALRRHALPLVTVRTSSPDVEVRFWATHALGELRYPEAATALLPRLFDDDASVRRIARRSAAALAAAGEAGQPLLAGLDHLTRDANEAIARRRLAIETLGEIRAAEAVVPLVSVLNDPSEDVADAARRALLVVARQDFGRDTRRWLDWWEASRERHRIEWLIDALMHELPSIRRAAGDELKQLTKVYFGYYDDLPKRERERAQQRYREWWEKEGRERF